MIGYFEGIDSERGITWRAADSLFLRSFLSIPLDENPPDHSTISRTRRLIDLETHHEVFVFVLKLLAEHAVDLESGAIVGLTLQGADKGDTTTILETIIEAAGNLRELAEDPGTQEKINENWMSEAVADKGYHSNQMLLDMETMNMRSYVSEANRGRRNWKNKPDERQAVYANRRRGRVRRGRRLICSRGELVERSFAHDYETGGMRRTHLRHHPNILKRLLIHTAGFNLALTMRKLYGVGKPRQLRGLFLLIWVWIKTLLGVLGFAWRCRDEVETFFAFPRPSALAA